VDTDVKGYRCATWNHKNLLFKRSWDLDGQKTKLILVAIILVVAIIFGTNYINNQSALNNSQEQVATLKSDVTNLQSKITKFSYNTSSGGGINVKFMPDPTTGKATVPMPEIFSFDRNHAMCRVETNAEAFVMPTYGMGDVLIKPNEFFMSMVATTIEKYEVKTNPDGTRTTTMLGVLDCLTEASVAEVTFGSRTVAEPATYLVEATDAGIGGGAVGDSFAFTVYFHPDEAPINHTIFGPEATFTGEMVAGEITILDPNQ
jgi:hypothetical protein